MQKVKTLMKRIYLPIVCMLTLILVAASCSNKEEVMGNEEGYIQMDINTLTSTIDSRAMHVPAGYDAKKLYVEIKDANDQVIKSTHDFANDVSFKGTITLSPGQYSIHAHSDNWDGSDSGFDAPYYVGFTNVNVEAKKLVKAKITCTQANVKLTINFDSHFKESFQNANVIVTSKHDEITPRNFHMGSETKPAYFPVGDINLQLFVTNKKGESHVMSRDITDVKARDHYIITYKLAEAGTMGGINIKVDDATKTYTYTIEVPRKSSTALATNKANAWSTFAYLSGAVISKTSQFDKTKVSLLWKPSNAETWNTVPFSELTEGDNDNYTYTLLGLTPNTSYTYCLSYTDNDNQTKSPEVKFTTEQQLGIENNTFDNWYKSDKVWYPNAQGSSYWGTSNSGSAGVMGEDYNVTTGITEGAYEGTSAQLQSMYVVLKFAAASLFTGKFVGMIGTNGAKLSWGVEFASRPTALTGYMKYTTDKVDRGDQPTGVGAPEKDKENDACQIFCALLTQPLKVANAANDAGYELSTSFDWDNDPRIIAYGELTQNTNDSAWKQFTIPLKYHTLTEQPKYMLIVCSSSKWGDYFYGSTSSKLLLDNFEFVYGNSPIVK